MSRIGERLDYRQFGLGAVRYCLNRQEESAEGLDNPRLAEQIRKALMLNRRAGELELDWKNERAEASDARNKAASIDDKVDRTLSSLNDMINAHADLETECRERTLAREMREELFPAGVYPITSAQFDEQHMHVADLLKAIDQGFTEHVDALGLRAVVESLRELNEKFGEQLDLASTERVTFDEVREARRKGRDAFHKVIFMIYGDYANEPEIREELLAPVEAQDARIARSYKTQGEAPDVDPETGEPTDPDADPDDSSGEEPSEDDSSDDEV